MGDLKSSTNTYLQSYLANSDNKRKLEKLERELENYSNKSQTNSSDNPFWKIGIPVSLAAVLAAVAIVVSEEEKKTSQS